MSKIEVFDIGDSVCCDYCGSKDHNEEQGGLLFGSNAVCPACTPKTLSDARRYGEEQFIRDRARPGETFAQFVLRLRGGDNTITVISD